MRVLICGSRTWSDVPTVNTVLQGIHCTRFGDPTIIHGAARGADEIAGDLARRQGWRVIEFPADWERHGKRAGYVRNTKMLAEGNPNEVYAFVDKPLVESRGTSMMVRIAREAGVPTYVVEKIQ